MPDLNREIRTTHDSFCGNRPDHFKGAQFPRMLLWRSEGGQMPFLEDKDDLAKAISAYITCLK